MKKLMVLDGNSIVNRAFYGVSQNLTTRAGQPTNAIFGFLNITAGRGEAGRPVRHLRPEGPHLPAPGLRGLQGHPEGDAG